MRWRGPGSWVSEGRGEPEPKTPRRPFSTLYDVTQRVAGSVAIGVFLTLFQVRERTDIGSALGGSECQ